MTDVQEMQQTFDETGDTQVLNPAGPGAPVRYPLVGTSLADPVHFWIVRNTGAVDIRVAFDRDADVPNNTGILIPALRHMEIPVITREYISVDGGDGSDVECTPFKFEQ